MSGECDYCGEHTLDCICKYKSDERYILAKTCGQGCPCHFGNHYTHLNLLRSPVEKKKKFSQLPDETMPLSDGINHTSEVLPVKWINVHGREEHEAIIRDVAWCRELGLDQMYEIMVYLHRWGSWLNKE